MTDTIFEPDELAADATGADTDLESQPPADQRPRNPDGTFAPKAGEEEPPANADDSQPGEDDGKGGTVPQAALHAERERRKSTEAQLAEAKAALARIAEFRDRAKAQQPPALPAIDDPAALEHLTKRLGEVETQQTQFVQRQQLDAADQAELTQLQTVMAASENAFRAEKPDYDAAINHVVQARAQELALYGLTLPQIQQAISEEAADIARSAVAQGRNPAELGYQIALSRGYRPEAAQTAPQGGGQAQATLEAIAAAKQASRSLGGGGGAPPQALNAEAIAAMDSAEFEALYSTPEGKRLIDSL